MTDQPQASAEDDPHLHVCILCDWVMRLPELAEGESALCPRCGHKVHERQGTDSERQVAWGSAALVMLVLAIAFPFMSFEAQGASHGIVVLDAAGAMLGHNYPMLALLVFATIVVLPGLYLALMVFLHIARLRGQRPPGSVAMSQLLGAIQPWMMSDVFIVGVLVAMIKILSLAELQLGVGFAAFCAYALLLLKTISDFDPSELWDDIAGEVAPPDRLRPGAPARSQGIAICRSCEAVYELTGRRCPRCGRRPERRAGMRLQITWALLVTAAILYVPALAYPVMRIVDFGVADPQSIIGGVLYLVEVGSWPIALIIFVASVVVPIAKMLALAWLCIKAGSREPDDSHDRTRLYHITEVIGRWSMIDVFVVALLAALVQAGQLMTVYPGPGILAFAAVVILTMIAAMTFEPRLLWAQGPPSRPVPA